jgi:hypothetical protein
MNLPKAYRSFDDLYDRIIIEADEIGAEGGSAIGNAFKSFGNAYADKMRTEYNRTASPIGLGLKDPNLKNTLDSAIDASSDKCYNKLKDNGIDISGFVAGFKYALVTGKYEDSTGNSRILDLKPIFSKPLEIKNSSGQIILYFNYLDWEARPTFGSKTLSLDKGYTNLLSNKDTINVFKSSMASSDYSKLCNSYNSTFIAFTKALDQFCNDLTDKTSKKLFGYDPTQVKNQFFSYLACVATPIKNFNIKSGGANSNLDSKIFWMFACLPASTTLNKP